MNLSYRNLKTSHQSHCSVYQKWSATGQKGYEMQIQSIDWNKWRGNIQFFIMFQIFFSSPKSVGKVSEGIQKQMGPRVSADIQSVTKNVVARRPCVFGRKPEFQKSHIMQIRSLAGFYKFPPSAQMNILCVIKRKRKEEKLMSFTRPWLCPNLIIRIPLLDTEKTRVTTHP